MREFHVEQNRRLAEALGKIDRPLVASTDSAQAT